MPKAENQFELEKVTAKIVAVENNAPKKRDDEAKPECVLHLSFVGSNTLLSLLHPSLKSAFYQREGDGRQATITADHLPELKYDFFDKPIRINKEYIGYALEIEQGIDDKGAIRADGCRLDRFKITLLKGGSTGFQLRCVMHVDALTQGRLGQMKNQNITLSFTAPEAAELPEAA